LKKSVTFVRLWRKWRYLYVHTWKGEHPQKKSFIKIWRCQNHLLSLWNNLSHKWNYWEIWLTCGIFIGCCLAL